MQCQLPGGRRCAAYPCGAAGAGYAVCLDFISDRPVRRWSEERKAAVRRRNLEKRINRHAPLFADELIARELAERPDYFQGK
ncbi:hypothetical protein [Escherichia coli]|uniref:hypothetical protein n=1 Tax=Escherichia coli TaxID=562 RepID=UPI00313F0975